MVLATSRVGLAGEVQAGQTEWLVASQELSALG